jgi:triosephosphate isomerase
MMSPTPPVMAGNWKMHIGPTAARDYFRQFLSIYPARDDRTVMIFPPAASFAAARDAVGARTDILLGFQNVHWEASGAYTGEMSSAMAADAGAAAILIGHSERRQLFGETDGDVSRKLAAVLDAGVIPVVCVGETAGHRDAGSARSIVTAQLESALGSVDDDGLARVTIAYEPVWAIGTGRTATPADAAEMHGAVREYVAKRLGARAAAGIPILYGGSVKPDNSEALLAAANVDGVLVGGASLEPASFAAICQSSSKRP